VSRFTLRVRPTSGSFVNRCKLTMKGHSFTCSREKTERFCRTPAPPRKNPGFGRLWTHLSAVTSPRWSHTRHAHGDHVAGDTRLLMPDHPKGPCRVRRSRVPPTRPGNQAS